MQIATAAPAVILVMVEFLIQDNVFAKLVINMMMAVILNVRIAIIRG